MVDDGGEATYQDFVEQLGKCESKDIRRHVMMLGLQVRQIARLLQDTVKGAPGMKARGHNEDVSCNGASNFESSVREEVPIDTTLVTLTLPGLTEGMAEACSIESIDVAL